MTTQHRQPAEPGTAIGAVVELLRQDFDGVTVSKIRFLEAQGLVTPQRTESGIRHFAADDIERLRYILTAQRDKFWPLKVIREHLARSDEAGETPSHATPGSPVTGDVATSVGHGSDVDATGSSIASGASATKPAEERPAPAPSARRRAIRLSPAELRSNTGLDVPTYGALKSFGLLRVDATGRHGVEDLEIARQAAALSGYGIEARHLRLFRVAADREIGLAEQILEPLRRRRARGAPGADPEVVQADIVARSVALHAALVRAGLGAPR